MVKNDAISRSRAPFQTLLPPPRSLNAAPPSRFYLPLPCTNVSCWQSFPKQKYSQPSMSFCSWCRFDLDSYSRRGSTLPREFVPGPATAAKSTNRNFTSGGELLLVVIASSMSCHGLGFCHRRQSSEGHSLGYIRSLERRRILCVHFSATRSSSSLS